MQVEIEDAGSKGQVTFDCYNSTYTKITDPYMRLNLFVFGGTILSLESIDNKLCVIFTHKTSMGRALLENVGTDCEIMSIPLVGGYPRQLINIIAYGGSEDGRKITITPRVIDSLY